MLKTRVIPCLLLSENRLVKTVKFKNPGYVGDPLNVIRIFNQKEVDELILLDILATPAQRPIAFQLISEIASECFMPLTYGGGIRSLDDIKKIFAVGVEKVSINSYAVENPRFIKSAADVFGSQSIIVSIDTRKNIWGKYEVFIHGGRKRTGLDVLEFALTMEKMGAGEILVNSLDRDGTWQGYDMDLLNRITGKLKIPVIACGGAGDIQDFVGAVKKAGCSAVAAGSMFVYQGKGLGVLIKFPARHNLEQVLT